MAQRVAVYGLKHGHIHSLIKACLELDNAELVAVAEPDPAYREPAAQSLGLDILDASLEALLSGEPFDILAVADAYGQRGQVLLRGLQAGKHLIGDKPLCTRLGECRELGQGLAAAGLEAHLMLTMRYNPKLLALQRLLASGRLGALHTCHAFGPHHLNWGSRPEWYWDPRLHGGILNDLMCHGLDLMRWLSGREMLDVLFASVSNAAAPQVPEFEDNGQCLCLFDGGAKFGGEVSYLAPPKGKAIGWLVVGWCQQGAFKIDTATGTVAVDEAGVGPLELDLEPWPHGNPLADFVNFLETGDERLITTDDVLRTSEAILKVQEAAVGV